MSEILGSKWHHNDSPWSNAPPWAIEIREMLSLTLRLLDAMAQLEHVVFTKENTIMSTLDDDLAEVAAQTTALGSVQTLLTSIEGQLAAALANTNLPPDAQAKVDALFASLKGNDQIIANALASGVPPAAPTPPVGS